MAQKLRSRSRWQNVRALKLSRNPLCERCLESGYPKPANQVHHIEAIGDRPELAHTMENLMSVCTKCHAAIEAGR